MLCPYLKLVGIMQETKNWYVCTHTYVVPENIPFRNKVADASMLFKKSLFWQKLYFHSKQWCESCVRDF